MAESEARPQDEDPDYVVAGCRPWNRATFASALAHLPGRWTFVATPDQLAEALARTEPEVVFFLHWSWIIAPEVVAAHECIVFHMTDVPYGRGGSPLQNLIERGHSSTQLTALRMVDEVDAGPVYARRPLSLAGTAEEVYLRTDALAASMIAALAAIRPTPVPQEGEVVTFPRRSPAQSEVPADLPDLDRWTDLIRMLDAEGYPPAFIDHGPYRLSFRRAARYDGRVEADVTIRLRAEQA